MKPGKYGACHRLLCYWLPVLFHCIVIFAAFPMGQAFFETPIYTDDLEYQYPAAHFSSQNISFCGRSWGYNYFSPFSTNPPVEIHQAPIEGNPVGLIEVINPPAQFLQIQCDSTKEIAVPNFTWINPSG